MILLPSTILILCSQPKLDQDHGVIAGLTNAAAARLSLGSECVLFLCLPFGTVLSRAAALIRYNQSQLLVIGGRCTDYGFDLSASGSPSGD